MEIAAEFSHENKIVLITKNNFVYYTIDWETLEITILEMNYELQNLSDLGLINEDKLTEMLISHAKQTRQK